jgi:hypothetical protein
MAPNVEHAPTGDQITLRLDQALVAGVDAFAAVAGITSRAEQRVRVEETAHRPNSPCDAAFCKPYGSGD